MSATIKIKRSNISGAPTSLAQGELAYSFLPGTISNGGDRLYVGTGTETAGIAQYIDVVGGKYFTSKLNHAPGTVTANSAIIVDANKSINELRIDSIFIDGNTVSTTSGNANIVLSPHGTGSVSVDNSRITNVAEPSISTDAATKSYVDTVFSGVSNVLNFSFLGDVGSDTLTLGTDSLNFVGGTGISSLVSNNAVTFNLENTGISPGTYGSSTQVPIIVVNAQGRITSASVASISTNLSISGDSGSDTVSLVTGVLNFSGGTGVTTLVTNDNVEISIGQSVDTNADVTFNSVTVNGTLNSDDITATNVVVSGNLTVQGNTTIINSEEILISDPIIFLNSNLSANTTPYQNAGISINRGNSSEVSIVWDESNDYWTIGAQNLVANQFIGSIDAGTF